ncbi:MAG: sugar transferase [Burkholderiales bacterium]|nr:sugar transferase [Burkholderiales bacterium]
MKRFFDMTLAILLMLAACLPMLMIALAVKLSSQGPVLHWSNRVGRDNGIFRMPKFRTMRCDTPQVATHLLFHASRWTTGVGKILRATSMDELPQLWSILVGHMSFVGPRPALFNQYDLIEMRSELGIHCIRPGLTGWAQVNGRDELPIPQKVALDAEYLAKSSLLFDLKILVLTAVKVLRRDGILQADQQTASKKDTRVPIESTRAAA